MLFTNSSEEESLKFKGGLDFCCCFFSAECAPLSPEAWDDVFQHLLRHSTVLSAPNKLSSVSQVFMKK